LLEFYRENHISTCPDIWTAAAVASLMGETHFFFSTSTEPQSSNCTEVKYIVDEQAQIEGEFINLLLRKRNLLLNRNKSTRGKQLKLAPQFPWTYIFSIYTDNSEERKVNVCTGK
jgi:hypothetical protein